MHYEQGGVQVMVESASAKAASPSAPAEEEMAIALVSDDGVKLGCEPAEAAKGAPAETALAHASAAAVEAHSPGTSRASMHARTRVVFLFIARLAPQVLHGRAIVGRSARAIPRLLLWCPS